MTETDPFYAMVAQSLLKEIDKLWTRIEGYTMCNGDTLSLKLQLGDALWGEATVHSVDAGKIWLTEQYQKIESKALGEDKDAPKTGD